MVILEWLYFYDVVSEYVKSILVCTENTLKAYKHIRGIRQEYFAVYGEYANRNKLSLSRRIFDKKQKKFLS